MTCPRLVATVAKPRPVAEFFPLKPPGHLTPWRHSQFQPRQQDNDTDDACRDGSNCMHQQETSHPPTPFGKWKNESARPWLVA